MSISSNCRSRAPRLHHLRRFYRILPWVLLGACVLWPVRAYAHQTSAKYLAIEVTERGATIRWRIARSDLHALTSVITEAATVEANPGWLPVAPTLPAAALLVVRGWLTMAHGGGRCWPVGQPVAAATSDARYVAVLDEVACGPRDGEAPWELAFGGFFALDATHVAMLQFAGAGLGAASVIVRADAPRATFSADGSGRELAWWSWIRHGVAHIWGGYDHVAFLLLLLSALAVRRGSLVAAVRVDAPPPRWQLATVGALWRPTLLVVTSFTCAHTLTLLLAARGVVVVPAVFVESVILLSIVYLAFENMWCPDQRWRVPVVVGFGLVHGLGFASALAELLPRDTVLAPLLWFNFGVELGQLVIVGLALPTFVGIAKLLGAPTYRRWGLALIALACIGVGVWVQRGLFVRWW